MKVIKDLTKIKYILIQEIKKIEKINKKVMKKYHLQSQRKNS